MKGLFTFLGVLVAGLGGWYLWKRLGPIPGVAGTGKAQQPPVAAGAPSPTLCQSLVTIGAGGAGAYYGGPQGAAFGGAAGATTAKPICNMAETVGKGLLAAGKWTAGAAETVGKATASAAVTGAKAVAGVATNPVGSAGTALAYGTGLKAVGAGINAVFSTGHHTDNTAAAKLKKLGTGNGLSAGFQFAACALRNDKDNGWTDTSSFCKTSRMKVGL